MIICAGERQVCTESCPLANQNPTESEYDFTSSNILYVVLWGNIVRFPFRKECSEMDQLQDDTERRLVPWLIWGMILQAKYAYMYMENKDIESYYSLPDRVDKLLLTPAQASIIHTEGWGDLTWIQPVGAWATHSIGLTTAIYEMRGISQKVPLEGSWLCTTWDVTAIVNLENRII